MELIKFAIKKNQPTVRNRTDSTKEAEKPPQLILHPSSSVVSLLAGFPQNHFKIHPEVNQNLRGQLRPNLSDFIRRSPLKHELVYELEYELVHNPRPFEPVPGVGRGVRPGPGRGSTAQHVVPVDPAAHSRVPVTMRRAHGEPRRVRPAPRALPAAARLLLRNAPVAVWSGHMHRCLDDVSREHQNELYLHHFNQRGPDDRPGLPSALPVSENLRVRVQVLRGYLDPHHHPLHPRDYETLRRHEGVSKHTVL